jgi:hypothetical protein
MSDPRETAAKDQRLAELNRALTCVVGGGLLAVVAFTAVQNKESLQIPDRNKLWADFWKKELSKPSGLPEFKPIETEFSDVKFDPEMLQPQTFQFGTSAFQPDDPGVTRIERKRR